MRAEENIAGAQGSEKIYGRRDDQTLSRSTAQCCTPRRPQLTDNRMARGRGWMRWKEPGSGTL